MSPLSRRIARVAVVVLSVQFVAALAIQVSIGRSLRGEVIQQVTGGMDNSGALRGCTERPGPWEHPDGWWTVWPLTSEGTVVGRDAPMDRVRLPPVGTYEDWSDAGIAGLVYASASPDCGGLLVRERSRFPLLEGQSSRVGILFGLRVLVLTLAAVALVALTALPLVQRIRSLSQAMGAVVDDNFEGEVADGAEDEIGDVARAFDAATATARERLERLEHRDAVLRRALADLTHDLRTPLTTLALSASGLPPSTAATTIRAEVSYLEGMARNFDALLGGDDEEESDVDLAPLLQRVHHRFAPLARDRELTFEIALPDEGLRARAGAVDLERAVSNLVHNAVRFAEAHLVLLLFRDGDELRLEVRDDGPGFGELSARAAERGVRGEEVASEGLGLGLAIAEAAARRYGGRLELDSGDDGETLVAIVLPVADAF